MNSFFLLDNAVFSFVLFFACTEPHKHINVLLIGG